MKRIKFIIVCAALLQANWLFCQAAKKEDGDSLKRGVELLDSGEMEKVLPVSEKLNASDRLYLAGLYHFYAGDYGKAAEEIGKSIDQASLKDDENRRNLLLYLQRLESYNRKFDRYEREHFILRLDWQDNLMQLYLDDGVLNSIYDSVGKAFDYYPKDRVAIEIYPTEEEFAFSSTLGEQTVERSGAIGICKYNRIMTASPRILPYGYRWIDTLCHEYIHFIVNRVSKNNCPLWLHEGIARYYETCWRSDLPVYPSAANINMLIDALGSGNLVPFSRMHPSLVYLKDQEEVSLAFSEVCSAVKYIDETYPGRIRALLGEMAAEPGKDPFRKVLGMNIRKFEANWLKHLGSIKLEKNPGAADDRIRWKKPENEVDEFVGVGARDYLRLGDNLRGVSDNKSALYEYNKALKLEPYNPVILIRSAKALFSLGDYRESENRLKLCIEKNPNFAAAYELLSEQYFMLGEQYGSEGNKQGETPGKAEELFEKSAPLCLEAIYLNPFNLTVHRNLGMAYLYLKKYGPAYRELRIVNVYNPEDVAVSSALTRLRAAQERSPESR